MTGVDSVWIHCGALLDGVTAAPQPDMLVRIEAGLVADVRPANGTRVTEPVTDFSASTICPGYIDTHVHLLFNHGGEHAPIRRIVESSAPDELALLAARAAMDCLLAGITTVRDCGDRDFVTLALRDAIAEGMLPGPRVLAAGPPVTVTGGHLHWCGGACDSLDEIRTMTRRLCARGVDHVKVMASGGNMTAGSNPLQPQFTCEELAVVVAEAHRYGRRVAAHASCAEGIRRSVRAGVDTIEHCLWRSPAGGVSYDPTVVAMMVEQGTWTNLTMAGISRVLLPEHHGEESEERDVAAAMASGTLYEDYKWARDMRLAGAPMMLSSDAGVRFTPFRRFDETLRCAIVALGISFPDAVVLATSAAAQAVGIADRVGSIAPGQQADLLVLDGVVAAQTTTVPAVRQVWRNGQPVVSDGRILVGDPA